MSAEQDQIIARKGRHAAIIIAGSMALWVAANFAGPALGLAGRYALLFDLAALAALIYAMVNIYQIWRLRQSNQG
jgi:ABC-type Co2+ transport system permease subunit